MAFTATFVKSSQDNGRTKQEFSYVSAAGSTGGDIPVDTSSADHTMGTIDGVDLLVDDGATAPSVTAIVGDTLTLQTAANSSGRIIFSGKSTS